MDIRHMMKLVVDDLYWSLAWNRCFFFQDDVITNLLGSGGLQVTVSSSIDPIPSWDSNCDLHIRGSSGPVSAW